MSEHSEPSTLFVTGATGVIGRRVVPLLVEGGHRVRAVARGDAKADELRAAGAEAVEVDLFDPDAVKAAAAGSDAIVHLATSIPRMQEMRRPGAWTMNGRLRTEATANLLDAARTHSIGTFVKESITFTYPDRGGAWIDETVEIGTPAPAMRTTIDGELLVERFTASGGRGIVLRFGSFLAPDAHHTDDYLRLARRHLAPSAGRARDYTSSVHVADAAAAVAAALAAPAGVYNVVDDEPLTRREFSDAFAAALGFGHLFVTPPWAVKLSARSTADYLLRSQRVSNRKVRAATGWAPAFPSAREGWAAVAAERNGVRHERNQEVSGA